jgi:tetratricopeptide (TPR) repeat protein
VRVEACQPPGLLASRVYIDLVDIAEVEAQQRLLTGVDQSGARPTTAPFPGAVRGAKRFPGQGPAVINLAARNPHFTGRSDTLEQLRERLRGEPGVVVTQTGAIHGLGGVGKTELALEFAYRYQSDYDIIWWITAEQPTSVSADLGALAQDLGIQRAADLAEMVSQLFKELRQRERWLLVYDNAERPEALAGLLPPGGDGRVLVTSRYGAWGKLGATVRLDVLAREEAVAFLARRTGSTDEAVLGALAAELGDLPLALEEAAAYLEETHTDPGAYLDLVRERARELFGLDQPPDELADQRQVAAIWSLSLERIHQQAPAAEALLRLCAFLAPEDIPRELPHEYPEVLPDELAEAVGDVLAYNRLLAAVGRFSLATVTPTSLGVHRLVQVVIQARLGLDGERTWAEATVGLLRTSFPDESWEVDTWQVCGRLLPHVLAAAGHAQRLGVAGEQGGWLLDRASSYLRERGLYRQARPVAEQALALTEAAVGPQHVEVAWRCDELARVLRQLGELADAKAQLERALAIGEATLGPDYPGVAAWRSNLGLVLWGLGDLAGARAQFERALAIGEATLGPDHPDVATGHNNLGLVLRDLGDPAGAWTHYQRALEIGEAILGPDHPNVAMWSSNLGLVLWDFGDLAGARAQFERALEIGEAALGPEHPEVAAWRSNLGLVLRDLGDLAGARAQFERALAISKAALGPHHSDVAIWRNNLGRVLRDLGDLAGARAQFERALKIGEATLGPNHPTVAAGHNNLGRVLRDLGDLDGARMQLERALAIGEAALGPNHPNVVIYRANLAAVASELGEPAEDL